MSEFERLNKLRESNPEEFRKLMLAAIKINLKPHAGQKLVLDSPARFKVLNCGRRWGKGHAAEQPVLTPSGWSTIGALKVGDKIIGSDGKPHSVAGIFPKGEIEFYAVGFRDGSVVECDSEHLWEVRRHWRNGRANKSEVLSVTEILNEGLLVDRSDGRTEHRFAVKAVQPVELPEKPLPLPPYSLGALLGDGSLGYSPVLSSTDPEIPEAMRKEGLDVRARKDDGRCPSYGVCGIKSTISSLGLNCRSEHKHVPAIYLTASKLQRLALLQGLMDTDGWLEGTGRRCAFASASKRLTLAVRELVLSLGGKVTPVQIKPTTHLDSFVLRFYMPAGVCPFRLPRKADRWEPAPSERLARQITSIKSIGRKSSICISVDSPDNLYVVNDYVLTHNTKLAAYMAIRAVRKPNQMVWWVAPVYKITKRGYAEVLQQLPEGVLTHDPPPESNFDAGRSVILRFKNGSKMEFYSGERPDGMLGAAVDFAVMDEAATMQSRIYNQIISPTLIDHKGGALLISTPRGNNWFKDLYLKGQDPQQPDWASWTFTTEDNPTLPEGEARRMAEDMPRLEADQEIYAKWVAAGSNVFMVPPGSVQADRVLENHLVEDCPPAGHVFLGIDLARTNDYTVLYGTRERDRKNVYFERMQQVAWAEQRRRIRRAHNLLMRSGASGVTLMVDEGNAGSVIVEDLQEAGFDVVGINFTTHKANMVRLLANDLERGRAFILDEKIDEFSDYIQNTTPSGRIAYSAPEGRHDDVVSAKMLSHWGCVNEGFGDVKLVTPASADALSADSEADPWDEHDDDSWDDLLDAEPTDDPGVALEAVGLANPSRRPTEAELLLHPDLWF